MAGVGKSTLALKLADSLKSFYPDSHFSLNLLGTDPRPLSPWEAMGWIIESCRSGTKLPSDQQSLTRLYRAVLAGQRNILLLDNAKDEAQVRPLLPALGSVVIITSRKYFSLPGLLTTRLDKMSPRDAQTLLVKIAPRIGDDVEALARACGYLPWALRLAGSAIATHVDITPSDYIQQLSDSEKRVRLIEGPLNLSYELLSPNERALWCSLSVFRDAFDSAAAAAVWDRDPGEAKSLLSEILTYNMIEWNEQTRRYRLHDLAQVFADKKLESQERDMARNRHAAHYAALTKTAYDVIVSRGPDSVPRGFALLASDWMNIVAGQAWAAAQAEKDEKAARLCIEYATEAAYFRLAKHDPPELVRWLETATRADQSLGDRKAQMVHLGMLAGAHVLVAASLAEEPRASAGSLRGVAPVDMRQALRCYDQAAVIARELGDRKHESDALQHLMDLYRRLGEATKAIESGERALAISRELSNGDRQQEAATLAKLGGLYGEANNQGRALQNYEKAAIIYRELREPFEEAGILAKLAGAHQKSGEPKRAIKEYQQALSMFRELGKRREEGEVLLRLGEAYLRVDYSRSIQCAEMAVTVFTDLGDRALLAQALLWLAANSISPPEPTPSMHIALGERAIEPAQRALAIARETGDTDAKTLGLQTLATVHSQLGLFDLDSSFPDRGTEAEALSGLGIISLHQGRLQEAKNYLSEGLKNARATNSRRHEAKILNALGKAHLASSESNLALDHFKRQLSAAREIRDQDLEADALWGMGIACKGRKRPAEAVSHYNEGLRIARTTGNKRQQGLLLDALGSAVFALGDRPQAIKHTREGLRLLESLSDPTAAMVRKHLASLAGETN